MDTEEVAKFMRTRMATERAKILRDSETGPFEKISKLLAFDVEAAIIAGGSDETIKEWGQVMADGPPPLPLKSPGFEFRLKRVEGAHARLISGVCDGEFGGGEGVAESDSVAPLTDGDPTAQVPDEEG